MSRKRRQSSESKCFFPGGCLSSPQSLSMFGSCHLRTGAGIPAGKGNPAEEMARSSGCHELQQQCLLSLAGALQGQHPVPPESCQKGWGCASPPKRF